MNELLPDIRNAVRAVILRDEAILMQKKWSETRGHWYTLPGGGQDVHETLIEALQRECEEEIGTLVQVEGLLHVADFYKQRETDFPSTRHLVEFLFACSVPGDYQPRGGSHPDKHQIDVVWLPLGRLTEYRLFPSSLAAYLPGGQDGNNASYLGVID